MRSASAAGASACRRSTSRRNRRRRGTLSPRATRSPRPFLLLLVAGGGFRRGLRPHRPPRARGPPPSGAARLRHRLAAVGRQRRVRLHRRRHRPADLRRGLRRDDPARHARAVGLAHGAQPERLVDRPLPLRGVRRERPQGGIRGHPGRRAHARDRVAAPQPAPAAPGADRLPAAGCGTGARPRATTSATSSRSSTCGKACCAAASGWTANRSWSRRSATRAWTRSRCGSSRRSSRAGRSRSGCASPTAAARRPRPTGRRPEAHETEPRPLRPAQRRARRAGSTTTATG